MGFGEKKYANPEEMLAGMDDALKTAVKDGVRGDGLPCAVAFDIARRLKTPADKVGQCADLLGVRLLKCQLGLFGYGDPKKIVKPAETVTENLKRAIEERAPGGKLSCLDAWHIAAAMGIGKMEVSGACETLGLKIGPCQLGAF